MSRHNYGTGIYCVELLVILHCKLNRNFAHLLKGVNLYITKDTVLGSKTCGMC